MKVDQLETFLRNCSCFAVLTDEQLERIADQAEFSHYKLGEIVFRQGDPGEDEFPIAFQSKLEPPFSLIDSARALRQITTDVRFSGVLDGFQRRVQETGNGM